MAIKRDITDEYDNAVANAYSRITSYTFHNSGATGSFNYKVSTWKSKAAYNNGKKPFAELHDVFEVAENELSGSNPLNGLYAHLLLHPKYSNGVIIAD